MDRGWNRRSFLKGALGCSVAAAGGLPGLGALLAEAAAPRPGLAVAKNGTPEAMVRSAVDALGGIRSFVSRGDVVVVKPNIGWDRTAEQAANTNPEVVRTVARLCLEAGAKRVRVMDRPCNDPRRCYKRSGIQDAVESLGDPAVTVEHPDERKYVPLPVKGSLGSWTFHKDFLEADKRINVPIAKHHNAARLTMSLKNVMGVLGGNRGNIHHDLDHLVAELNTAVKFDLIVLDAVRILTGNGPQGGRLQDVRQANVVLAGTDPVAADAYAATLFGIAARDVPHVVYANQLGLGEIDLTKVRVAVADLAGR